MVQRKMDKRLAGLTPREQSRFRNADLYSDDPWNNARVTRAFRCHRSEMDFAAWNKGFQGNDILFADSVKKLLRVYADNKSTDAYLRHSISAVSELCLSLPDSVYWADIFDYPVQITDIFGCLRVQWFIGYNAVCASCGADSYDVIKEGCNGLKGSSLDVARQIAIDCSKMFDNLEDRCYTKDDIERFGIEVKKGDSDD